MATNGNSRSKSPSATVAGAVHVWPRSSLTIVTTRCQRDAPWPYACLMPITSRPAGVRHMPGNPCQVPGSRATNAVPVSGTLFMLSPLPNMGGGPDPSGPGPPSGSPRTDYSFVPVCSRKRSSAVL